MPFPDTPRVDARDKVRGKALFAADDARPDLLHARARGGDHRARPHRRDRHGGRSGRAQASGWCSRTRFHAALKVRRLHHGRRLRLPELPADAVAGHRVSRPADRARRRRDARSGDRGGALVEATYASEPFSVTLDAAGTETVNQADTPLKNFIPRSRRRRRRQGVRGRARQDRCASSTARRSTRTRSS